MSKWTSDAKQRHSRKYLAVIRELQGGEPAGHLTRLTALPCFTVSYSEDGDKITRHRTKSRGFRDHGE